MQVGQRAPERALNPARAMQAATPTIAVSRSPTAGAATGLARVCLRQSQTDKVKAVAAQTNPSPATGMPTSA